MKGGKSAIPGVCTYKRKGYSVVLYQHYNKPDNRREYESDEHSSQAGFTMKPNRGSLNRTYLCHLVKLIKRRQQDIHHQKIIPVDHQPQKIGCHRGFRKCRNTVDESQDNGKQNRINNNRYEFADDIAFSGWRFLSADIQSTQLIGHNGRIIVGKNLSPSGTQYLQRRGK